MSANEVDAPAPEPPVVLRPSPVHAPAPVHDLSTAATDVTAWRLLSASRLQLATKRSMDIVGAVLALVLLSPILLVTSLAILVTSRGGVFYTQTRVGRDGRPFTLFKFRTMHRGADALMDRYEALNELDGPIFKIRNDPRVTRVGRTIRRFSVDELPQFVNVLRGDMSLVGPRPFLAEEYTELSPYQSQRLLATPGLTGVWQVSGRCDVDFHRWMEMDLDYIRDWSLRLDLGVILRTLPAVLSGRGSY